ncbi:bcl-2-like protein 10 [Rhinophrynus dorsalis]
MTDHLQKDTSVLLEDYLQHCVGIGCQAPLNPIAQTLRRVAGEVLHSNRSFFDSCEQISGDPRTILKSVSAQLPQEGGLNWGRVVSLIAFAGVLAQRRHKAGSPKELADLLTRFLADEHRDWLVRNGGWDGFQKAFNKNGGHPARENSIVSNALVAAAGFGIVGLAFLMAVR